MESNALSSLPAEAVAAIERGELINAIKLVREHTGLGLKEAKDAVENFQAGLSTSSPGHQGGALRQADASSSFTPSGVSFRGYALPQEAIAEVRRGQKLLAIKLLRDAYKSLSLAAAKDLIDAYAEQQSPSLHEGFADHTRQVPMDNDPMSEPGRVKESCWRSTLFWLAIVLLGVFGVWTLFARL